MRTRSENAGRTRQMRVTWKVCAREEHGFKNVWKQDGRIMYCDAVSDRVKLYYN